MIYLLRVYNINVDIQQKLFSWKHKFVVIEKFLSVENEFTIKEIRFGKTKMLLPRNREYPPVEITDNSRVVIIGPVISVIRKYR